MYSRVKFPARIFYRFRKFQVHFKLSLWFPFEIFVFVISFSYRILFVKFVRSTLEEICIMRCWGAVKCVRCRLLPSSILLMGVRVHCRVYWWWLLLRVLQGLTSPVCVLCRLVSFHFRFTFFALLLPTFIVELYSCRSYLFCFYFSSNLHFPFASASSSSSSPSSFPHYFWQGWLDLYGTYSALYASDFDPPFGGWSTSVWPPPRFDPTRKSAALGKVSCK